MDDPPFTLESELSGGAGAAPGSEALAASDGLPEKEALAAFRRAVQLDPGDPDYAFILGAALADLGRHAEAIKAFQEAIAFNRLEPSYQRALGGSLFGLGRFEAAAEAFEEALRLLPDDVEALNGLALAWLRGGRSADAVARLRVAVGQARERPDLRSNLGVALFALGKRSEAERAFREAVRLAPAYPPYRRNLGLALVAAGRHAEAVECFRAVMRRQPENAAAHLDLADALFAASHAEEGARSYDEAALLDPAAAASRHDTRSRRQAVTAERARAELRSDRPSEPALHSVFWDAVIGVAEACMRAVGLARDAPWRRLRQALALALLLLTVRAGFGFIPAYWNHYAFRDELVQVARASVKDDGVVLDRLMHAVRERRLDKALRPEDFTIETRGQWRRVACRYTVAIPLVPGIAPRLRFAIDVEEPFLVEPGPIIF